MENNESRRKTLTIVTIGDKRLFQSSVKGMYARTPEVYFAYILHLLGTEYNSTRFHKLVKDFKLENIIWKITNEQRGALGATIQERKADYDLEEIMSMILKDAKKLAERAANEALTDCVIAVPSHFDTDQRLALVDAAKLAGLNPLAFISENVAASIKFAVDVGTKDKGTTNVMYINMGAASFKVTIISHSKVTDPDTKKIVDKIEIIGEAWDETLGGRQFDYEMAETIADKFNALPARKGKPDIRGNAKAMRRILEKSEEIKEKLSAGKFMNLFLDNLADSVSFNVNNKNSHNICRDKYIEQNLSHTF